MVKRSSDKSWAGIEASLVFAQASLAAAPGEHLLSTMTTKTTREAIARKVRFVERHEPRGEFVARFVLPLDDCPRLNELLRSHFGRKTNTGKRAFRSMQRQNGFYRGRLLVGRPLVRFVRFSVKNPDDDSSWTKVPLDVLVNHDGKAGEEIHFRYLVDDDREHAETRAWWEPAPAACQFVYFDLWEGGS